MRWSELARVADRIDTYCMACDGDRKIVRSPNGDWSHCYDSIHAAADQVRAVAVEAPPTLNVEAILGELDWINPMFRSEEAAKAVAEYRRMAKEVVRSALTKEPEAAGRQP